MDDWPNLWNEALAACKRLGGEVARPLTISGPAELSEIESVEKVIRQVLPDGLRRTLLQFSSAVDFSWRFPENIVLPDRFGDIFSGGITWSLDQLVQAEKRRQDWEDSLFPNPDDAYDAVWHKKLGWLVVPNGDVISFDNQGNPNSPVIYLSHDGGKGHGLVLGKDFIDFVTRWSLIGCPGPEDWQMMPFVSSPIGGIEPDCSNARAWRKWFGLRGE